MLPEFGIANRAWSRCTALLVAAGFAACVDDSVAPAPEPTPPAKSPRVIGFAELTFSGIGTPDLSSSLLVAPTLDVLEALRAQRERSGDLRDFVAQDLTMPVNSDSSGNGTIQLTPQTSEDFTHEGVEYLNATYNVRNAQVDGLPYDTERTNLTFLAVSSNNTINQTAVRRLLLGDGTPAPADLALEVLPTGLVAVENGVLTLQHPDVLQVLTEGEAADVDAPAGVTSVFPYGFVVRHGTNDNTRTLAAVPDDDQFDGVIDFAFRIPEQANPSSQPETMSVLMLALDHSDTLMTQSLEGQAVEAHQAHRERAEALSASAVTVLPGGMLIGAPAIRRICSVRTAGTAAAPTAHLVNVDWVFDSFSPNPYATDGSASFISSPTDFQATFSAAVEGAGPDNFTVRGLQSGPAFLGQTYSGNGTATITTPQGSFFPGEEIEIAVTSVLACPQPPVARYRVAAAEATGTFGPDSTYGTSTRAVAVTIGDLTNDGVPDVVTANANANNVSVFLGNGGGTFQDQQTFSVGSSAPWSVAIGDLNGDGFPDLVTANCSSGNVSVLLGNGAGTFPSHTTFAAGGCPTPVAIGDLNGDGFLDLVTTNESSDDLSVLLGNGDGTFQDQRRFDTGDRPEDIAIGDLNGDGVLDLVTGNATSHDVSVLLGTGDGNFQDQQTFATAAGPFGVAIGDLSGDGVPDIVTADSVSTHVSMLLGHGTGTFQEVQTFTVGTNPTNVAVGDLNGDGVLDIATANSASQNVSVLLGSGDGNFQNQQTFPVSDNPFAIAVGDLNGNGVLDIVTASQSSSMSVLLGNPVLVGNP